MPIDRFNEVNIKAHRGDVITVTLYYGLQSLAKGGRYPLRLDFEVQKWPQQAHLRGFSFAFASFWLDDVILPLQSSDVKWHKMTVRVAGQHYLVPLVGKYGRNEGSPASERQFCVSLIPGNLARTTKTFRLRGVADCYEQFDRPDVKDPTIPERSRLLEKALVSSCSLYLGDGGAKDPSQEEAVLRYVRLPDTKGKDNPRESGGRIKRVPIQFTAAFCIGFQ